jgi:hypothetical protein
MKSLEKEISMSFTTSSKLLVVMTEKDLEKNRNIQLSGFKLVLDNNIELLTMGLPSIFDYDKHNTYLFYSRNGRFIFRVSHFNDTRKWELYPSVMDNKDSDSILFLCLDRDNNIFPNLEELENSSILCDYIGDGFSVILAELTSLYDIDTLIESAYSLYRKKLRWELEKYFRKAFPFNIPLPKWLSE